jgi:hypothetical protein
VQLGLDGHVCVWRGVGRQVRGSDTPEVEDELNSMYCAETDREIRFKGGSKAYADMYRAGINKPR